MPVTLYFDPVSQPSRACWLFLKTNKIRVEERRINILKGEQHSDEYKRINYFQHVPCIDHNGFVLTESGAILRYLIRAYCDKVAGNWYPDCPKKRARIDEYISWHETGTRKATVAWTMTAAIPKITGKAINATAVQDSVTGVENMIKQFEEVFLAKKSHYIGGSNYISIADLLALCEFEQMNLLGYDLSSHEKVSQWMVRCRSKLEPHYSEITETLRQLGESAK